MLNHCLARHGKALDNNYKEVHPPLKTGKQDAAARMLSPAESIHKRFETCARSDECMATGQPCGRVETSETQAWGCEPSGSTVTETLWVALHRRQDETPSKVVLLCPDRKINPTYFFM